MQGCFSRESKAIIKILLSFNDMKYVFAGNHLEYRQYMAKQEKNGLMEISKVEHLNRIKKGGTLLVVGNYKKRMIWPQIEMAARAREIIIEEQFI